MDVVSSYVAKEQTDDGEKLLRRRYLMCSLMFKNAQREGPVVNLRLGEVKRALCHKTQGGDNVYVYKVWPLIFVNIYYCCYDYCFTAIFLFRFGSTKLLDSSAVQTLFYQKHTTTLFLNLSENIGQLQLLVVKTSYS